MLKISQAIGISVAAALLAACGGDGEKSSGVATPLEGPTKSIAILDSVKGEVIEIDLEEGPLTTDIVSETSGRTLAYDRAEKTLYLSSDRSGHSTSNLNIATGRKNVYGEEYRSDYLVKARGPYLYSVYTQTTMTDNILRPRTQGYVQRISTDSGNVEFSDRFGTPEFSALAVHPSSNVVYAIEPQVQTSSSDPLCLQDTCKSKVIVYSLAISTDTNPYSGGITTQWFEEVSTDHFMNVKDAAFSPNGNTLYLSGAPGSLWAVSFIDTSVEVMQLQGLPEYQGTTYLDIEDGGRTGLVAARDLGLYRVELESGKTWRLAGPETLFTGVSGLKILE